MSELFLALSPGEQILIVSFCSSMTIVLTVALVVNGPILYRQAKAELRDLIDEARSWLQDESPITDEDAQAIAAEHDREHRERVLMAALAQIGDSNRVVSIASRRAAR